MSRKFILVTASCATKGKIALASGMRKLKRGTTLAEFITAYLDSIGVRVSAEDILEREGTHVVTRDSMSWNFTEYDEADLLTAVSHLSRDELLRDLKELLPLKGMA